mgnify:CR=1 FL=1|jgi:hypothetical protein
MNSAEVKPQKGKRKREVQKKAAPRRIFSDKVDQWFEMQRSLPKAEELRNSMERAPTQVGGRFDFCMWLIGAAVNNDRFTNLHCGNHQPSSRELWAAPNAETERRRLCELLLHAIQSTDPVLVAVVFTTMRFKQIENNQQKDMPIADGVDIALLKTPDDARKTLLFLALHVRRPRLVRWFLTTALVTHYAQTDRGFSDLLTAIAVAINDCVFSPQRQLTYEESKVAWSERYTAPTGLEHSSDSTLSAAGWRWVVCYILKLVGDKLPDHIYEDTKHRNGKPANLFGPVSLLVIGIRCFEIDDTFLKRALRYRKWSSSQLAEAMIAALSPEEGVRGPAFVDALVTLYHELLECWKTNEHALKRGVVCSEDTIGGIWRLLADNTSGFEHVEVGGETGNGVVLVPVAGERAHLRKSAPSDEDALMRHPLEWEALFEAMILCHAPDTEDSNSHLWDSTSPFFASLIRMAIVRIFNDSKRTRILGFLMKATDGCTLVGKPPECGVENVYQNRILWSWLSMPGMLSNVCMHHIGLLQYVVDKMCTNSKKPLTEFVNDLHLALWLSSVNKKRQACRLLIGRLKDGNMPMIADADMWGGDVDCSISWLAFFVKEACVGADQTARDQHGDDYADFLNARVDADFRAVVAAADWDADALDQALRFASEYNRPIAAAVLMSSPSLRIPDASDAFLMAINSEIYAPGAVATSATASNFATFTTAAETR